MLRKLVIAMLVAVLLGTFVYSGYVVAREVVLGQSFCEVRGNVIVVAEDGTLLVAEAKVACPFGMVDCPFPGQCKRYVDADGDGYCDLSKPQVVEAQPADEGQMADAEPCDLPPLPESQQGLGQAEPQQGYGLGGQELGLNSQWSNAQIAWQQLVGTVVEYDHEMYIITEEGEIVEVSLGQSAFLAEAQGFNISLGDRVLVIGYMEEDDDELKAGQVYNLTTGQHLVLREENGRPLWSGQGGGRNRG